MAREPYLVLVERDAAQPEIAAAYRRPASENHSDFIKTADASARIQESHAAYRVLRDPAARLAYERNRLDGAPG